MQPHSLALACLSLGLLALSPACDKGTPDAAGSGEAGAGSATATAGLPEGVSVDIRGETATVTLSLPASDEAPVFWSAKPLNNQFPQIEPKSGRIGADGKASFTVTASKTLEYKIQLELKSGGETKKETIPLALTKYTRPKLESMPEDKIGSAKERLRAKSRLELELGGATVAEYRVLPVETATHTIAFDLRLAGGKQVKVGGSEFAFENNVAKVSLPVDPFVIDADLPTVAAAGEKDPQVRIPIELETDEGTWTGALRIDRAVGLDLLEQAKQGPVSFPDDTPAPAEPKTLLEVSAAPAIPWTILGEAKTLRDVDLVAFTEGERKLVQTCRYEQGKDLHFYKYDMTVEVYDRRTGKRVASERFKAGGKVPKCELVISAYEKDKTAYSDGAELEAFLAKFVAGE